MNRCTGRQCVAGDCCAHGAVTDATECAECGSTTKACPFYRTTEHARCSRCDGRTVEPVVIGEVEALATMNIGEGAFVPDAEVEERALWIQKSKNWQDLFAACDDIQRASHALHLGGRRLRVAAAEKLMTAIESKNMGHHTNCAYQKAIVIATTCPWLLSKGMFWVGLCYFGRFGDGPTKTTHVHNYIH